MIGYVEARRMLAAWCELRQDFRHFRADRIVAAEFLDTRYPARPAELRARWRAHLAAHSAGNSSATVSSKPGGSSLSKPS